MEDRLIIDLIQRQQGQLIDQATTIHTLRARVNQLEGVTKSMGQAHADEEGAMAALDKVGALLMDRVRMEREACSEPGTYARTVLGNSVALTLYQELCQRLSEIRASYGL